MTKTKLSFIRSEVVKTLYLDEHTADVYFILSLEDGHSKRVPAHKALLIASSKVFREMFDGHWKEQHEVPLPHVLASNFEIFLQYIYFDKVELSMENAEKVMDLGYFYDIEACFNDCASLLEHNLTDDNACRIYELAILYKHEALKIECEIFISLNTKTVFKSPSFLECDRQTLVNILRLNLRYCSESDVFNACMAWIRRAVMKSIEWDHNHVLNYIGFGSMTTEELNAIRTSFGFSNDAKSRDTEMIDHRMDSWDKTIAVECKPEKHEDKLINGIEQQENTKCAKTPVTRRSQEQQCNVLEFKRFKGLEITFEMEI